MMSSYLRLLTAAGSSKPEVADTAVAALLAHLKATGRMKLLPTILAELKKSAARTKTLAPTVEAASEKESAAALLEAKAAGIEASQASINPSLISGWRATKSGALIDRSGKRALIDIYRKVTS